jgi:lysyl-tRNA synthetase class I
MIRALRKLIMKKKGVTGEAFQTELFALTKKPGAKEADDIARQQRFFKHVYQLLLGQDSGPRLAQFLLDIDPTKASALLDV